MREFSSMPEEFDFDRSNFFAHLSLSHLRQGRLTNEVHRRSPTVRFLGRRYV